MGIVCCLKWFGGDSYSVADMGLADASGVSVVKRTTTAAITEVDL